MLVGVFAGEQPPEPPAPAEVAGGQATAPTQANLVSPIPVPPGGQTGEAGDTKPRQPEAQAANSKPAQQGEETGSRAEPQGPPLAPDAKSVEVASAPSAEPEAGYEFTELKAYWAKTSRGLTALEGVLWVPEVKMTIRNTGDRDLEELYFKALFLDHEGTITDEDVEVVESIPAGYTRGPVFLRGSVGYTSSNALALLAADKKSWRVDLFEGKSYSGPWKKIRSLRVKIDSSQF